MQTNVNYDQFLNALLEGDRSVCANIIRGQLNKGVPVIEIYESLLKTALYQVGELWEHNKISVATEHLASAIIEAILNEIYPSIRANRNVQKSVALTCVEGELHEVGIRMVSDVFEMHAWNTLFLGSNTPASELARFLKEKNPDVLAISISLYFHIPALEAMIRKISAEFPNLLIFTGGQAFRHGGEAVLSKYKNVIYTPDLFTLNEILGIMQ